MTENAIYLTAHCVSLRCVVLSRPEARKLSPACRNILSFEELERARLIASPWRRRHFLAGRMLLRKTLACCLQVEPQELVFRINEHGKPWLVLPADCPLQFSLSHSGKLVVCAVTLAGPIGVDIEYTRSFKTPMEVAERFFDATEVAALARLYGRQRNAAFLTLWTLKEAFVKAQGQSLHSGSMKTSFLWYLDENLRKSDVRMVSHPSLPNCQFASLDLPGYHRTSLAVYHPEGEKLWVRACLEGLEE